jgi:hypothetical protein
MQGGEEGKRIKGSERVVEKSGEGTSASLYWGRAGLADKAPMPPILDAAGGEGRPLSRKS